MKEKLLLLHGALGSKKQLALIKELLAPNFEVYSLDFAGHASHISDEEFSIDLFAQNLINFLDRNEINDISIFGYSMGGYVALYAAKKFPDRIKNIVTLGTKFDWSIDSAAKEIKMLNPEIIEAKIPHFAQKLQAEQAPQNWKTVMNKTARMMQAMAEGQKLFDKDFETIQHSVTIGIGDSDKMVSLEESKEVAALLPNIRLKILEGVEHPIDKINLEQIADYIRECID